METLTVRDNAHNISHDGTGTAGGLSPTDSAAVTELISDIEGELRLHQARIAEFLEGTPEFAAVADGRARGRLLMAAQAISSALADLSDLV